MSKNNRYIMLTGVYGGGKSVLLETLADGEIKYTPMGRGLSEMKNKNLSLLTWEMGGRNPSRPLMRYLYSSMDAVIFVIDSQDRDSFEWGVSEHVKHLLAKDELKDVQFLVLANKQDLPGAMTCQELRDTLSLSKDQDQRVEIIATSLVTGQGLPEVRDWIEHQYARRQLQRAVVQPLEKAVPPTLKSAFSRMSSALKQAFGLAKNKLPPVA